MIKNVLLNHLPWKIKYIIDFKDIKGRLPIFLSKKDYSDYIFIDNFFGRHNHHAFLADKYKVREYVEQRGLGHTLTKLFGVWDDARKIDFDSLPEGFALKCNHSCAMNIICQDKSILNRKDAVRQLNEWLNMSHPVRFEQHYRHIKPMIICEELIPCMPDGSFPYDYKIHCVDGKPLFIQLCFERTENSVGFREIYSTDWKNLHLVVQDYHYTEIEVPAPKHLKEMVEYADILSRGLKYARIDFYDTPERVIFGEVTLTPMGGWLSYFKQEALDLVGVAIRDSK